MKIRSNRCFDVGVMVVKNICSTDVAVMEIQNSHRADVGLMETRSIRSADVGIVAILGNCILDGKRM